MATILSRKSGGTGGGGGGPPSGAAGGDLSGTYPNPGIAAGVVDTTELADDAVDADKIDGADAADIRTLLAVAGLTTNTFTGAQTLTGGIAPASGNPSRWPQGARMTTDDRIPTSGTLYYVEVFIPINCTLTGLEIVSGTVGGTNLWIPIIWNSAGAVVANGNLAGATAGAANGITQYPFTATYAAKGPGQHFIGFQANGNTARFASLRDAFCRNAGGSTAGVFGTVAAITPPTAFASNVMPLCWTY